MKITLRYGGTLDDASRVPRLQEDFQDIAAIHGWPVDLLERTSAAPRRGFGAATLAPPAALFGLKVFIHPQTDPLWLTFDETGILTRLGQVPGRMAGFGVREAVASLALLGDLRQPEASMQTSIGGAALHRTVVGLLDYLKRAYMRDLRVTDETGYWLGRDDAALSRLMDGR